MHLPGVCRDACLELSIVRFSAPCWLATHDVVEASKRLQSISTYQVALAACVDASQAAARGWTELALREPLFDGAQGHSVFLVSSFASATECEGLIDAARKVALLYEREELQPRERVPVAASSSALKLHSRLLKRLFSFIEAELPSLAESLFGQVSELASMNASYSAGEPAVNIYTLGGDFLPHTDNEHLSVLIPLDDPSSFEGGGTAFWADTHLDPDIPHDPLLTPEENDLKRRLPPAHFLKPAMGTALLFGGGVVHGGLSVTCGTRHLFVMSFSLKPARR